MMPEERRESSEKSVDGCEDVVEVSLEIWGRNPSASSCEEETIAPMQIFLLAIGDIRGRRDTADSIKAM